MNYKHEQKINYLSFKHEQINGKIIVIIHYTNACLISKQPTQLQHSPSYFKSLSFPEVKKTFLREFVTCFGFFVLLFRTFKSPEVGHLNPSDLQHKIWWATARKFKLSEYFRSIILEPIGNQEQYHVIMFTHWAYKTNWTISKQCCHWWRDFF
jgi:hypothetical protein